MEKTAYKFNSKHLGQAFFKELEDIGYEKSVYSTDANVYIIDNYADEGIEKIGFFWSTDESKTVFQLESEWSEALQHAKEQIGPAIEEGKWWYINGMIVFVEEFRHFGSGGIIGYGFDLNGGWNDSGQSFGVYEHEENRPATDKEVESALSREGKRRGYEKGTKYKCARDENIATLKGSLFYSNLDKKINRDILTDGCGGAPFYQGKWAKIIGKSKQFFGYDVEVTDTEVAIGCQTFNRTVVEQILNGLNELDNSLTISDIISELIQIGIETNDLPF